MEEGKPDKARRLGQAATRAVVVVVGFLYLYFVDPLTSRLAPPCLFTAVFGVRCPGCGSLRALHALAQGDLKAALAFNAPVVLALPVAALLSFVPILRRHF